ncbi:MAG: glutamate ligase domain-containing protein, partial [Mycobacteriaceae bacterium]
FRAKSLLFTTPQDPGGTLPTPVVCVDDDWGRRLAGQLVAPVTVSTDGGPATWTVTGVDVGADGLQHVAVDHDGSAVDFSVALPGAFNVANATLALGCLYAAGAGTNAAALADVRVPGRMQAVTGTGVGRAEQDFLALVDYAHKPAAVAAALDTLADQSARAGGGGRIAVVLGAGGNRDHEKRPLMGAEAARRADAVFVTDDNPRDEDPPSIRAQILDGARGALEAGGRTVDLREIGDRADAIRAAVDWARRGDIVIVAGKGHETGQIVGDTVIDFDDAAVLAQAIDDRQEPKR